MRVLDIFIDTGSSVALYRMHATPSALALHDDYDDRNDVSGPPGVLRDVKSQTGLRKMTPGDGSNFI